MKATRPVIERALDRPTEETRLFLLHGPDESSSRALAERLGRALGQGAERIDLDSSVIAKDPALLADEAASISLFGEPRYIRVRITGDDALLAVEGLLAAPRAGNPVLVIAGALKSSSKLLKAALASPTALVFGSYLPDGAEADRMAATLAREVGLRLAPEAARDLVAATGADRGLIGRELEKLALFLDASPDHPKDADRDALARIGADSDDGDLGKLIDAALSGSPATVVRELDRLSSNGIDGVAVLRAAQRRVLLLIQLRADIAEGTSVETAVERGGKALFWKEKPSVSRQLQRWSPERLAHAARRLMEAQQRMLASGSSGSVLASAELLALGRAAAARS